MNSNQVISTVVQQSYDILYRSDEYTTEYEPSPLPEHFQKEETSHKSNILSNSGTQGPKSYFVSTLATGRSFVHDSQLTAYSQRHYASPTSVFGTSNGYYPYSNGLSPAPGLLPASEFSYPQEFSPTSSIPLSYWNESTYAATADQIVPTPTTFSDTSSPAGRYRSAGSSGILAKGTNIQGFIPPFSGYPFSNGFIETTTGNTQTPARGKVLVTTGSKLFGIPSNISPPTGCTPTSMAGSSPSVKSPATPTLKTDLTMKLQSILQPGNKNQNLGYTPKSTSILACVPLNQADATPSSIRKETSVANPLNITKPEPIQLNGRLYYRCKIQTCKYKSVRWGCVVKHMTNKSMHPKKDILACEKENVGIIDVMEE